MTGTGTKVEDELWHGVVKRSFPTPVLAVAAPMMYHRQHVAHSSRREEDLLGTSSDARRWVQMK